MTLFTRFVPHNLDNILKWLKHIVTEEVLVHTCTISTSVVYNLLQNSLDVVHGATEWMEGKYLTIFILIVYRLVSVIRMLAQSSFVRQYRMKVYENIKRHQRGGRKPTVWHQQKYTNKVTFWHVSTHTNMTTATTANTSRVFTSLLDPKHPSPHWRMSPDHKTLHPKLMEALQLFFI